MLTDLRVDNMAMETVTDTVAQTRTVGGKFEVAFSVERQHIFLEMYII